MSLSTILSFGFIIFAVFGSTVKSEDSVPSYINPCSFKDKDINQCIKDQIESVLPELSKGIKGRGVPSTDPVKLDDIIIDGKGLKLQFKEAAMHGLGSAKLTDFKISIGKVDEVFKLAFKANLSLTAKYTADGKILIIPIKGEGDATINAQGVVVSIESKLTHIKDSNGIHFKLTAPSYKYTIEKTTFSLKNLFSGSQPLSASTHKFVNDNWRQVMDDLAPPVIKQIVTTVVKAINKFFSSVTINQIVKDFDARV